MLVMGAQDQGSAPQAHVQSSRQKGIPQHGDSFRISNAPNNTISLGLVFASHRSKQRLFLSPSLLDLMQVSKGVFAQMSVSQSALICVFYLLTNHGYANQTPVV